MRLIILIGISGAGKTDAFMKRRFADFADAVYLSADDLRAVIGTDRTDQTINGRVFESLKFQLEYFLRQGKDVIVDATNPTAKDRKSWIKIAHRAMERGPLFSNLLSTQVEKIAYFKCVPLSVALERNRTRGRNVPEDIIGRQHAKLTAPTKDEGFDTIIVDSD